MPDLNFIINYKLKNKIKSTPIEFKNQNEIIDKIIAYLNIDNIDELIKNISLIDILKNKKQQKIHIKLKNIF